LSAADKGQPRMEIDLGTWTCARGSYALRLVIRRSLLAPFVARAIGSIHGRAALGGGLFTLLAKRVAAAPMAANDAPAPRPGPRRPISAPQPQEGGRP
jgi:hypothetical protein